jgi:hypothetical protein
MHYSRHTAVECTINPSYMITDFSLDGIKNPESHAREDRAYADASQKLDRHTVWLNIRQGCSIIEQYDPNNFVFDGAYEAQGDCL